MKQWLFQITRRNFGETYLSQDTSVGVLYLRPRWHRAAIFVVAGAPSSISVVVDVQTCGSSLCSH